MEWLRRTYYRAILGPEEGEKRYLLDKEWRSRFDALDRITNTQTRQWLASLPDEAKPEGADVLIAQSRLIEGREKAVRMITRKNRLHGIWMELAGKLESSPELEPQVKACEAQYLAAAAEVEKMKADVGREEQAIRRQTAAFYEKYQLPKQSADKES